MSASKSPFDLTGQWHGTFAYPSGAGPATPFIAEIIDIGGRLSGAITEPDAIYQTSSALAARLNGHRAGQSVDFVKIYVGAPVGYENPVDYVGQIAADGKSITGVWSLLSMDGTFEMFREDEIAEPIAQEIEEEVEIPVR